jgi:hypothetical protein
MISRGYNSNVQGIFTNPADTRERNTDPHDAVMKAKLEKNVEDDNEGDDDENNDLNFAEFISRADLRDSDTDKHQNNIK